MHTYIWLPTDGVNTNGITANMRFSDGWEKQLSPGRFGNLPGRLRLGWLKMC